MELQRQAGNAAVAVLLTGPTVVQRAGGEEIRVEFAVDRLQGAIKDDSKDIAVVVPHVAQAGAVRALLADMPDVLVGTVNALQGLERPAVVALHPMAGYRSAESFALDAGRMCVTLSRHRAHLTILTDPATAPLLDPAPPTIRKPNKRGRCWPRSKPESTDGLTWDWLGRR